MLHHIFIERKVLRILWGFAMVQFLKFFTTVVIFSSIRRSFANDQCENGICTITDKPEEIPKGANAEGRPREATSDCVDRYPKECVDYAAWGECEKNPGKNP